LERPEAKQSLWQTKVIRLLLTCAYFLPLWSHKLNWKIAAVGNTIKNKKRIGWFCLGIFLVRFYCPHPALSQTSLSSNSLSLQLKETLAKAKTFEDIFTFAREIPLKVNGVIGEVTRLDVGSNGNLLIVDGLSHKTWLFDREGNLIKDIDPSERDFPGVKWLPQRARFGQNNIILIQISRSRHLFLFDQQGEFMKAIPTRSPFQYRDFVISAKGYIYGYSTLLYEFAIKKINFQGKVLAKGGIFPKKYKNFISRSSLLGGGLVIDSKGNIYQYNPCGPEIYKLSPDLRLLKTFHRNPPYYKRLARDFPDFRGDPAAFINESNRLLSQATLTFSLHLLRDSLLVVQYLKFGKKGGFYLDICDLEGNYYTQNPIVYRQPIRAAQGDCVYRVFQPQPDAEGHLPNPVIQEYRLNIR